MSAQPSSVPPIFFPVPVVRRLGAGGRVVALVVAVGCLTVLGVAAYLQPSTAGVGTHTDLPGLAPCGLLRTANLPCPSCGMTTSFAHFVRGNLAASLWVQPGGTLLAITACAGVWAGAYIAITGRPVYRLLRRVPTRYYVLVPLLLGVAAWAWKIFIHLRGIDGWG